MNHAITSALALSIAAVPALAQSSVQITFENLLPGDSNALTPVFGGMHDGTFDLFEPGQLASPGLENVAELGSTMALAGEFNATMGAGPSATTMGGPILGGGSASLNFDIADTTMSRFFTFASMVVPTNDLFIGNNNAIEVFDSNGNFNGPITFTIFGGMVWDAGTEANDALDGGAFIAGVDATGGTPEANGVALLFDDPNAQSYLDSLVGLQTAPGFIIGSTFTDATPIARVTIIPAPGAAALLGSVALIGFRRRRA